MRIKQRNFICSGAASLLLLVVLAQAATGQQAAPGSRTFTLDQAVDFALANYPAVRAALERISAAHGGIELARTSYLPRADLLWQGNRATRNNIVGLLLPQSVVPPISGPVLPTTSGRGVWGSAVGMLFSWDPFDFGYRRASVDVARAGESRAAAEASITRLDVAVAVTNTFLAAVAAQERVRAAQADVQRREILAKTIHTLVVNQLRPGADASRADAELAAARTQLIEAEAVEQGSRAALAALLGIASIALRLEPGAILQLPPSNALPSGAPSAHPLAAAARARLGEVRAREQVLDRSYFPRFTFETAVSGRGSGANPDGSFTGGTSGLGLDRGNWAAGLQVTFSLFDLAALRARKQIELANQRSEQARYDQTIQDLTGQIEEARTALEGARRVADNTPIELQAAREAEAQARARYQAGLATIVEVADAQRLLVQAETEDALARVNVWGALFAVAAAQGNLQPALQQLSPAPPGGK